jgi:hypothetical protein
MSDFTLEIATKLFLEGDLPRLFNYIAFEFEQRTEDRIIETIDSFIDNSDDPNVAQHLEWLKVAIRGEDSE